VTSPSPTMANEAKFQTYGPPSNLDRCGRCGNLRSSHGPEWSCPTRASRSVSNIPLLAGSLFIISGFVLVATVDASAHTALGNLSMIAVLVGITLLVMGALLRRRLK
jgi:hypothetical protein